MGFKAKLHRALADISGDVLPLFHPGLIMKLVAESVNNSVVLQDDNDFFWTVKAGELWSFLMFLNVSGPATADLKFDFTLPAGAIGKMGAYGGNAADVGSGAEFMTWRGMAGGLGFASIMTVAGTPVVIFGGLTDAPTVDGIAQFRWAQAAAVVGNTTFNTGSFLIPFRRGN